MVSKRQARCSGPGRACPLRYHQWARVPGRTKRRDDEATRLRDYETTRRSDNEDNENTLLPGQSVTNCPVHAPSLPSPGGWFGNTVPQTPRRQPSQSHPIRLGRGYEYAAQAPITAASTLLPRPRPPGRGQVWESISPTATCDALRSCCNLAS